jgi:electron transfer flavoprotein alpha subunit
MARILVVAEHDGRNLREISFELLGMARSVGGASGAGASGEVKAVLLGDGVQGLAAKLAARGADEVIYVEGAAVAHYSSDAHRKALEPVLRDQSPDLVLFGNTPNGWDLAPLVAARFRVPLATGCSRIELGEDGGATFTRKAFNGKFVHRVRIAGARPMIATVDKGAAQPFEATTAGTTRTLSAGVEEKDARTRFVEIRKGEAGGVDLTQATIIVSAGRGIGAPEKIDVVRALAEALGGQVGASRAVTDAGWLPHEHQIGSSGVSVSPKLYVACGISGAIQHVVGMKGSGYIVAINKDADAPIFGVADVGVVGDLFEILPALTKAVKEAKG